MKATAREGNGWKGEDGRGNVTGHKFQAVTARGKREEGRWKMEEKTVAGNRSQASSGRVTPLSELLDNQ
ncbi:MAG: hypothetical protein C0399_08650 [Syntrophus sp. (in: bacteria)]|nr:hypothetical protein [Syntrophus sp. (in: bacteria)]